MKIVCDSRAFLYSFLLLLQFATTPVIGAQKAELIKRDILALWASNENNSGDYTRTYLHRKLEVVFNHYGLRLNYVNVTNGIPDHLRTAAGVARYRGMVSWYRGEIAKDDGREYLQLLSLINKQNKPMLILGELGVDISKSQALLAKVNQLFNPIGLNFIDQRYNKALFIDIKKLDQRYLNFERSLSGGINSYQVVRSTRDDNSVLLSLTSRGVGASHSDPVVLGKFGGYVQYGFDIFEHPKNFTTQWIINPFKLIDTVFLKRFQRWPTPDITTMNGSRVFYGHIDGDGYINVSLIDRKTYSGKIIIDRILKKYQLPMSISMVMAEVDPDYLGNKKIFSQVRELYRLPYIEPASHTYFHPLSWNLVPTREERDTYLGDPDSKQRGAIIAYKAADGYQLDYSREIEGSMDYLNRKLLPVGKQAKMIFWSGSCTPPVAAMKLIAKNNFFNINGGDSRFDSRFPSYSHLYPLVRMVGSGDIKYTQYYSSNSNENTYTNLWHGPYNGYREVVDTFNNSNTPIRISPINIYYHFYSGERPSAVSALEDVYQYVLDQRAVPVYASEYVSSVKGYMSTQVRAVSDQTFTITNHQPLRTFRFDGSIFFPDYQRSKNVIGHLHFQGSLYLFVGAASSTTLYLTENAPIQPYLKKSNGFIDSLSFNDKYIEVVGRSHVIPELELANLKAGSRYSVLGAVYQVEEDGVLRIRLKKPGQFRLSLNRILKAGR
ncbi:MAG: hypothetical protein HN353_09035 [Bdellovibrionales bacterium]|nr:hypothetical protein [Bdellovibrionales bacterium]MBT7767957.1 hypothetical protein [Bdellovibrionales bacterium]